jgi:modulator of FtsH protease HflK
MTRIVLIAIGVALLLWTAATSVTLVKPGERAVVRRFGRVLPHKPGPGLYCGWPWGLERVDRVPVGEARRVNVGFTGKEEDEAAAPAGQLLTGDHNLVNVQAEISYRVNEDHVEQFALNADRVDPLLLRLAVAALTEWIAGHDVDRVLARGQIELPAHVRAAVAAGLRPYDLGVQIERASIVRIFPPDEVKAAFDEVAKAQEQIGTRINLATQKKDQTLSNADGTVIQKHSQAAAYANEQKLQAQAEVSTFLKQLGQYRAIVATNPDYLNALWQDDMTRLYARMKEAGRIDVLDHYLSKEGLTITQFPLMPKKK